MKKLKKKNKKMPKKRKIMIMKKIKNWPIMIKITRTINRSKKSKNNYLKQMGKQLKKVI